MTSNLADFSDSLNDLAEGTETLMVNINSLTMRATTSLGEMDATMVEARGTLQAAGQAMPELERTLSRLGDLGERLNRLADDNFDRLSAETLPELDQLLRETRKAANAIEDLARRLEAEPSALVHRRKEGGVEIAR